ncbi:hypothetical protein K443DRAFT_127349 [Laccaria amethystina LaAM-08-1]|uniref:AMP-dependent synthetase/ligase domain-containing protein n=1 Tax=Laccaria amethystina LaAM-08-1 TaxID=1095629 RepID=A0A0C9YI71_9AGAR|nr:hypothetical protein K443DRAFT_127349 [Laccaria amethystina LaAM-08-1]
MHQYFAESMPLWRPRRPADSCADALRRQINRKYGLKLANYHDLHRHSVEDDNFWLELWEFLGIISSVPPQKTKILENGVLDEAPVWFPGARLNYAENLLHRTDDAIAITATGELGVITNYTFRELREMGILDRYRQITPKFVFAEIEVSYGGKPVDLLPKVTEVIKDLSCKGLQQAVLLPSRITGYEINLDDATSITLSAFLESADGHKLEFEQLPFSQPLFILYSSGTTGKPKCIVHSAGTGWMMWTFMLTGLACGSRVILYDGSPFYPDLKAYLQFINDQGVSILGTSPRFLAEIQGKGINPQELGSSEALKTISCTGAVLTPPLFEWAFHAFGSDVHLVSMSGGTDICSSCECCKSLGMKVEVFDPSGNNIEHLGEPGELVCTRPHPSLPVCFWNDEGGKKFLDAYFSMYPGIWRQGDLMVVNQATKGIMILGRSDGVLNPSGVRFGSAEIYSALEPFSKLIDDSLCIGQRRSHDRDERVLLFVKMRAGYMLSPALISQIRITIRRRLSARHVPAYIFEVSDIPYTVNGKKIEIAVKQIVSGSNVQPSGTVANPESLQFLYIKAQ